ncbi:hypothetical protein SARC_16249, partial [Sphaeroforma arctica JP610]
RPQKKVVHSKALLPTRQIEVAIKSSSTTLTTVARHTVAMATTTPPTSRGHLMIIEVSTHTIHSHIDVCSTSTR